MISPACSPSFLCLDAASYPGNPDGVWTCYFMERLATFPCTRNGQSMCTLALMRAWEAIPYTKWCKPFFTPTSMTFMCCVPSVRASVLPPTPFTLYLGRCLSAYETCTYLVGFESAARYMMRPSLESKLSSIGTRRIWRLSHLLTDSCLLLSKAYTRWITVRRESVLRFGSTFGARKSLSITY